MNDNEYILVVVENLNEAGTLRIASTWVVVDAFEPEVSEQLAVSAAVASSMVESSRLGDCEDSDSTGTPGSASTVRGKTDTWMFVRGKASRSSAMASTVSVVIGTSETAACFVTAGVGALLPMVRGIPVCSGGMVFIEAVISDNGGV